MEIQTQLNAIFAICQQVRETHAKMTPGPWCQADDVSGSIVLAHVGATYRKDIICETNGGFDATGIALQHNVSLALVETTEILVKAVQLGAEKKLTPRAWETTLQRIADIWKKAELI